MATETTEETTVEEQNDQPAELTVGDHAETVVWKILCYQIIGVILLAITFQINVVVFLIMGFFIGLAILFYTVKSILIEVQKMQQVDQ